MLPQLGARHAKGYFDTGQDDPELLNHQYVSVEFVELAAQDLGWQSPDTVADTATAIEDLEREVRRLQAEVDDLNRDFEAIDVLESSGYTKRRKPGRPRKEAEHADR